MIFLLCKKLIGEMIYGNKNVSKNIVIAILLIIIIALIGFIIYDKALKTEKEIIKCKDENTYKKIEKSAIDDVTALTLVQYLYDGAMKFYTFENLNNCIWKTDNDSCIDLNEFWDKNKDGGFIKITNYDETINNIFTKNGKEQFKKFMKEDISTSPFIKEENNNTYVLAPTSGFYFGYVSKNMKISKIEKDMITATIDIIDGYAESQGETPDKVTKKIIIKKINNKWLVEEFAIPMIY